MKQFSHLLLFVIFCITTNYAYSQQSYGGKPLSFSNKFLSDNIDHITLSKPNMEEIYQEDIENEKNGRMYMVGRILPITLTMQNSGTWDILDDGTKVWRLKITAPDAKSLVTLFSNFYLPKGSQLFLYNENKKQIVGAFDDRTNPRNSLNTSIKMVEGETTYYEYIAPSNVTENAILDIEGIIYNYRGVDMLVAKYSDAKTGSFLGSDNCQVNVNCPEGDAWVSQKKAVCLIYCNGGFCSGSLVNTLSENGEPYILTADHCGGDSPSSAFHTWQFYFHFESSNCSNPSTEPPSTEPPTQGATFRARGPINSTGSDFLLLELDGATQQDLCNMGCYYNGWDISGTPSASGVSIHHPSADIKKISTYTQQLQTATYGSCLPNAHWKVVWAPTATNHGVTEPGSSGSPIFSSASKLIVGTLTGGSSYCSALTAPDLYGKMNIHWDGCGSTSDRQLKPWLDPNNVGQTSCPGKSPCAVVGPLNALFTMNPLDGQIIEGGCIHFTDASVGNPNEWEWTFSGSSVPTYTGQFPPNICYSLPGTYSVILTVSNGITTSSCTATVIVSPDPNAPIVNFEADPLVIEIGGLVKFKNLSSNGPFSQFVWEFEGGTPATETLFPPIPNTQQTIDPSQKIAYNQEGEYNVVLRGLKDGTIIQKLCIKQKYIRVVPHPKNPPKADFIANYTYRHPGETVNFIDLSTGTPFTWKWEFQGGTPASSSAQNPQVKYNTAGTYTVKLTVTNPNGSDIAIKTAYIIVANTYPCTDKPKADFQAVTSRLIPHGSTVTFINTSTGSIPTFTQWTFNGAIPKYCYENTPSEPILYPINAEDRYDVTLTVSNSCGSSTKTKKDYVVVYSGIVHQDCDTATTRKNGEVHLKNINACVVGHSDKKYKSFASYFENETYKNQIKSIIIPINEAVAGTTSSFVEFCIWEPDGNSPSSEPLGIQKVLIKDLKANQNNEIKFSTPIEIDGPFYAGFRINLNNNDKFLCFLFDRGTDPEANKLFFRKQNTDQWLSTNEIYNISAAMDIKIAKCLSINIEDISVSEEDIIVYPNPANTNITILLNENHKGKVEFILYDILGKQHIIRPIANNTNEYNINLSDLQSGMYYLQIKTNSKLTTKKIILTK